MREIKINLLKNPYDVMIGNGILTKIAFYLIKNYTNKKIIIITDDNVWNLYEEKIKKAFGILSNTINTYVIKNGEESKNFQSIENIIKFMASKSTNKNDLLITFGGGVVGDIGGLCASLYMRGIDYIQIPTTLLSQVDSSVGGKTGVNLNEGKNLIGAFYQPKKVFIDTNFLETLPDREFSSGMAEIIKYAVLFSKELFDTLSSLKNFGDFMLISEEIISKCVDYKGKIVIKDEFDKNIRAFLNLGHTFGHAIEKMYDYKKFNHGEAVANGIYLSALYSNLIYNKSINPYIIKEICEKFGLEIDKNIDLIEISKLVYLDKKADNESIKLILINEIGDCFIQKEDIEFFKTNMKKLQK